MHTLRRARQPGRIYVCVCAREDDGKRFPGSRGSRGGGRTSAPVVIPSPSCSRPDMHCINGVICRTTPAPPHPTYPSGLLPSPQHLSLVFIPSMPARPRASPPLARTSPSSCSLRRNSHLSSVMKYLRVHSAFFSRTCAIFPPRVSFSLSFFNSVFLAHTHSLDYTRVLTRSTFRGASSYSSSTVVLQNLHYSAISEFASVF